MCAAEVTKLSPRIFTFKRMDRLMFFMAVEEKNQGNKKGRKELRVLPIRFLKL